MSRSALQFIDEGFLRMDTKDELVAKMMEAKERIERLEHKLADANAENNQLRHDVGNREEEAYRHGLGDRAHVLDDNRVLRMVIDGLMERHGWSGAPVEEPRPKPRSAVDYLFSDYLK